METKLLLSLSSMLANGETEEPTFWQLMVMVAVSPASSLPFWLPLASLMTQLDVCKTGACKTSGKLEFHVFPDASVINRLNKAVCPSGIKPCVTIVNAEEACTDDPA